MTEKKSILLDQTYTSFIDLMLSSDGQVDHLGRFATDDVMGYGTTKDEIIHNLKGLKDLAMLQRKQSADIKFHYELMPVFRKIMNQDSTAIIVDEIQITMHVKEEKIELQMRLSTILDFIEGNWKVVHWHGSKPEYDSGGSDTWHKEEWKQKNEELQKMVDEKTAILETKNKELEIEASLEKVRAVAMGMQKPDELMNLAIIFYKEIITLGFADVRNTMINIFNDEKETFLNYDYSYDSISCINEVGYNSHPLNKIFVEKMQKVDKAFMLTELSGNDLDEWKKWRISEGEIADSKLDQAKSLYYYEYSIGKGSIGISTFKPITEEQLDTLQKFRNLFNLAYQHFSDIKQAEAQTREAKIELGLERVRTRAMAMQDSGELAELVDTLIQELTKLDFSLAMCIINIIDEDNRSNNVWATNPETGKDPEMYYMKFEDYAYHHGMWKAWKAKKASWIYTIEGEEKKVYDEYLFNETEFRRFSKKAQKEFRALERYVASFIFSEFGGLQTVGDEPLSAENMEILARFGKVFDLTYTRFNDLKQAEAQAREAQIEAALERVRAQSMAMHKSEELKEVIQVIFEQLVHLNINAEHAGIVVDYEVGKDWNFWVAETQDIPSRITVPYLDAVWDRQFVEAKEKGKDFFATQLNFEEKNSFYQELLEHIPGLTKKAKNFYFTCPGLAISTVIQADVALYIENFSGIPYSDDENNTLSRFVKVFQQTYTRFLDLQNAEAQAREAQIETALERVRSQSMGMQTSEDLSKVTTVMFEQLRMLGGELYATGIVLCDKHKDHVEQWHSTPEAGMLSPFIVPTDLDKIHKYRYDQWKKGVDLFSIIIEEDFIEQHFNTLFELPSAKLVLEDFEARGTPMPETPSWEIDYGASFKYGYLLVSALKPFEEKHILPRFSKVFEQTYTRFLDLTKAEEQAREAQIEAALEKVRSRSLAMHTPNELDEVVVILVEKLKDLNVVLDANGVVLCTYFEDSRDVCHWISSPDFTFSGSYLLPYFDHVIFNDAWQSKEKGDAYFSKAYSVEEKNSFWEYAFEHSDYRHFPEDFKQWVLQNDQHILSFAWQKNSAILIPSHTGVVPSENDVAILKRFARVFEQAYTRFLDLQKAEAQAREAQIVASLERIRYATMAMHRSEELSDVLSTLFEQFDVLHINPSHAVLTLIDQSKNTMNFRMTGRYGHRAVVEQEVDLTVVDAWVDTAEKWKKSKPNAVNVNEYPAKILPQVWEVYDEILSSIPIHAQPKIEDFPNGLFITEGYCRFGYIGFAHNRKPKEEEKDIVKRFAAEFGAMYQRFLDLQKAEAQAREAQIENALEKVRSQTMAMQKGEDLKEVVVLLYKELITLGVTNFVTCGYVEVNEKINRQFTWVTSPGGDSLGLFYLPLTGDATFDERYAAWKKQQTIFHQKVAGEVRSKHLEYAITTFNSKEAEEMVLSQFPDPCIFYCFNFSHGYLHLVTGSKLKNEEELLLARFTRVFEQTYARFLDLQKAEEQAREAQVEAALERVRAQAMGMRESADLFDIVVSMRKEFIALGHQADYFWHMRWLPDNYEMSMTTEAGNRLGMVISVPKFVHEKIKSLHKWEKSKKPSFVLALDAEGAWDYIDKMNTYGHYKKVDPDAPSKEDIAHIGGLTFIIARTTHGEIGFSLSGEVPDPSRDSIASLERFAGVFDLAYRRFEDLKTAEKQNRETQIELALERIRAKTMAMRQTSELQDVINVVHQQFKNLNIDITGGVFIAINAEIEKEILCWGAGGTADYIQRVHIPFLNRPIYTELVKVIKKGPGFFSEEYNHEEKIEFFKHLFKHPPYTKTPPAQKKEVMARQGGYTRSCMVSNYTSVFTVNHHGRKFSDADNDILKRFGQVFEQTYTRFLDLQKAEEQAHEAQIEASLERIRSRALSMQKSTEVGAVNDVLFDEFEKMGIDMLGCGISVINEETDQCEQWRANQVAAVNSFEPYSYKESVKILSKYVPGFMSKFLPAWKAGDPFINWYVEGEKRNAYINAVTTIFNYAKKQQKEISDAFPESFNVNFIFYKRGWLSLSTINKLTENEINFSRRFVEAFDFAHTRFLDLQNAEEQAREAQIEAALERVRSKTMAMHNSDDVGITVVTLLDEVLKLGIDNSIRCGIGILEGNEGMETWSATSNPEGEVDLKMGMLDMTIHPMLIGLKKAWKSGKTSYSYDYIGDDVFRYYQALNNEPNYPFEADLDSLPENEYHKSFFYSEGILFSFAPNPISEEAIKVLDRFARVFGQTYRRYRDLQKAEAQAKEAQIEAALERVRSKAMAMHSSEDLTLTVDTFFAELKGLNVSPHRCGVGIVDEESRIVRIHTTDTNQNNEINKIVGDLKLAGHPVLDKIFEHWKSQEEYFPILRGKEIEDYYKVMNPQVTFHDFADDEVQYGYYFYFNEGGVYAWTNTELNEQDIQIFRRYTSVLSLTYRRYMDLKEAEAQAKEAIKQASLDRMRGQIASMRSTDDLQHITPLIWRELETLDVPFIRCGVFIVDEAQNIVNVYLTTPEGGALGALQLPLDANELTKNTVDHWQKKKAFTQHWDKNAFVEWMQSMEKTGQVSKQEYQGGDVPPESLDLHFLPFDQGMLYVGNTEPLSGEKIDLVQSLARAFAIAYARYEDFKNLEAAKGKIENTLTDLKSTQTQLIHAEKMASLGELTAGIAHEIQNPLNFVNNFSDVSVDLIEEMNEEIETGNTDEVKDISLDLKQNLQKINHHGQRASSIVKGMLEHSRTSDGHKELTNINELADEYLRLAYHGLRAKDKSFNADFKLNADENLPQVKVIGQDIGRVLLNLINNAFYACAERSRSTVSEKAKQNIEGYKPVVIVSTKQNNGNIEIVVKDNGNGIPENVKEKIFQPFFTTKPTGEGTGLGLSMSYDIITKGHGGTLSVETKEGEGTEFTIRIPL
jgi:signal transduction histidine kinase